MKPQMIYLFVHKTGVFVEKAQMIYLFVHKIGIFVERSQRFACLSTKQTLSWRFSGRREISLMWLATQKRGYMLRSRTSGTFRTCPPKGHFRGETSIDLPICPQNGRFCGDFLADFLVDTKYP